MSEAREFLDRVRERASRATPGPWENSGGGIDGGEHMGTQVVGTVTLGSGYMSGEVLELREPDAEFIAHAREDVPALLDEVERLWEARASAIALADMMREQRNLAADNHDEAEAALRDLTTRLDYGDGITEPQADIDTIVRGVTETRLQAQEDWERAELAEAQVQAVRALADRLDGQYPVAAHDIRVVLAGQEK